MALENFFIAVNYSYTKLFWYPEYFINSINFNVILDMKNYECEINILIRSLVCYKTCQIFVICIR